MAKTSLRVMFINLENLFSPGISFYGSSYSEVEYAAKVSWIVEMISRAHAHVVAFTELGAEADACMMDIMDGVNDLDLTGWPAFQTFFHAAPAPGSVPIRTAVLSRFPLSETGSIVPYPAGFSVDLHIPGTAASNPDNWLTVPSAEFRRPIAYVRISPPQTDALNLFVVHLKSKRPSKAKHDDYNEAIGIARAAIQRNVEAAALRYFFDRFLPSQYEEDPRLPTLVVGDFNDTPTSVPIENLRGAFDAVPGPSRPWSEVDKRRLLSCARLHMKFSAHQDKLYSYVHNENFELIDQAFVTPHLVSRFKRMEVYNDHVLRHQDLSSPTQQEQQWKSYVSDHGALVLEFSRML